jgi:hypothetical protein
MSGSQFDQNQKSHQHLNPDSQLQLDGQSEHKPYSIRSKDFFAWKNRQQFAEPLQYQPQIMQGGADGEAENDGNLALEVNNSWFQRAPGQQVRKARLSSASVLSREHERTSSFHMIKPAADPEIVQKLNQVKKSMSLLKRNKYPDHSKHQVVDQRAMLSALA